MSRERERLGIAVGMLGIGVVGAGYALWGVAGAGVGAVLALAVAAFMLGSSSLPAAVAVAVVLVGALALTSALTGGGSAAKPRRASIASVGHTAVAHPDPPAAGGTAVAHRLTAADATIAQLQAQNRLLQRELVGARARSRRLAHQLRTGRRR